MIPQTSKIAALVGLLTPAVLSAPGVRRQTSLDDWLSKQESIAEQGVLANIGSSGSKVAGALDGVVVASPSKSEPDYFYTWTRDAALTIKALVDRFLVTKDPELEAIFKSYISSQTELQKVENPSGGIDSGGLGEPKFHVNLTEFTGEWGRPQRDGPALRATALIAYAQYLLEQGDEATVKESIWPVVTRDLDYVVNTWDQKGFDLWEEVDGFSYFTLAAQRRSLIEGDHIAGTFGLSCTNCADAASKILEYTTRFWNDEQGYMMADIDENGEVVRSGKGTNTVLASVHTFDQALGCEDALFQPCSANALSNLKVVADSMRPWPINANVAQSAAPSLGRYIEDVYFEGNPWYLTTSAAAEQLYYALATWDRIGSVSVTDRSLAFFQDIYPQAATGSYTKDSEGYTALTGAVRGLADGYMGVVQKYTPADGSMAEQFSKLNGTALSAANLTWSYAALLTAKAARDGHLPPSWGAAGMA